MPANPFAHPELLEEGLEPHTVPELWMMATERANRVVDATDQFDRKLAALRSHRSQVGDGEHLEDLLRPGCRGPPCPPVCPTVGWPRPSTWWRPGSGGDRDRRLPAAPDGDRRRPWAIVQHVAHEGPA